MAISWWLWKYHRPVRWEEGTMKIKQIERENQITKIYLQIWPRFNGERRMEFMCAEAKRNEKKTLLFCVDIPIEKSKKDLYSLSIGYIHNSSDRYYV